MDQAERRPAILISGRNADTRAVVCAEVERRYSDDYLIAEADSPEAGLEELQRLAVRGPSLASSMSEYLIKEMETAPNIDIRYSTEVVGGGGEDGLDHVVVSHSGGEETVPTEGLFVLIGTEPHTAWRDETIERDEWAFLKVGRDVGAFPLARAPYSMETSLPGVFAAGDVRRGSVRRVASGVGSGAIAVQQVHQYLSEQHDRR